MPDDLREFAEQALRHCENTSPHIRQRKTTVLLEKLARGIIAERPADEPLTEEWIRSIGFADDSGDFERWLWLEVPGCRAKLRIADSVSHYPGEWFMAYGDEWLPRVKTKRQVRLLCGALGIELKETKP